MIHITQQSDRTVRWTFTLSLVLHLLVIFIFTTAPFFRSSLPESTPYYVDIISLPVPDPAPADREPTAPSPLPVEPARQAAAPPKPIMTLPAKQPSAARASSSPSTDQNRREQEAREFSEKMSRLERVSDARHQADALASLQKKVAEGKGSASSTTSGINPGADYGAYIQSRLKDALNATIVYNSQKPEAAVHLYIDRTGKLIKYVMVRNSADKLFNNSVIRAIEKARADFPPVPSGKGFDKLYVFSPHEGIK